MSWCSTYLRVDLTTSTTKVTTAAVRLSKSAAIVLSDGVLVAGEEVTLSFHPGGPQATISVRGRVTHTESHESLVGLQEVLDPPVPTAEIAFEETTGQIKALVDRELTAQGDGRRVAVVDDDPTMLWLIQSVLHTLGLDAICIYDPLGATNVIAEAEPTLIILDLNMPELPGRELCKLLKADPRTAKTPIIFLSAEPLDDIKAAAADADADGYVAKGANLDVIISEIRKHLG